MAEEKKTVKKASAKKAEAAPKAEKKAPAKKAPKAEAKAEVVEEKKAAPKKAAKKEAKEKGSPFVSRAANANCVNRVDVSILIGIVDDDVWLLCGRDLFDLAATIWAKNSFFMYF